MEKANMGGYPPLTCPSCENGDLARFGYSAARCDECGQVFGGPFLDTLHNIQRLPEVIGTHPCECGHPQMRCLPDGVFRCPCCRSEVVPASIPSPTTWKSADHNEAYWCGWLDGRYKNLGLFTNNRRLAVWENLDRLDYYRGHQAGSEARGRRSGLIQSF